jgi:FlaA1/EpsC-like NDP-sugar epimerase
VTERILVTGASGSIGYALVKALDDKADVLCTDIRELDVRKPRACTDVIGGFQPTLIYHLAGAKHAPEAEHDPVATIHTNVTGTDNVLNAARLVGARVILASTCKACDPETVYGATKLIAERMTLAAGGSVARFYNVRESSGNVFEYWRSLPEDVALPVTPCSRYFITLEDAVGLLLAVAKLATGRYTIDPGPVRYMTDVAHDLYPGRAQLHIPPRRGDRLYELREAASESRSTLAGRVERIVCTHDAPAALELEAVA